MGEWWVPYAAGALAWLLLCWRYRKLRKPTKALLRGVFWTFPKWIAGEVSHTTRYQIEAHGSRFFDREQKVEIRRRAQNRCEWHTDTWERCTVVGVPSKQVQHDHVIPHHYGGATVLDNAALLCVSHNGDKSDRMPTDAELDWLAASRATYFDCRIPDPRRTYA